MKIDLDGAEPILVSIPLRLRRQKKKRMQPIFMSIRLSKSLNEGIVPIPIS